MSDFGDKLAVGQATVSRYESGQIAPSRAVMKHLMELATDEERTLLESATSSSAGFALQSIRARIGQTAKQFALDMGISERELAAYESGRVTPIDRVLRKALPLANESERSPILAILDIPEDLIDGWSAEPGESKITRFRAEVEQIIAANLEVPDYVTSILRVWRENAKHPRIKESLSKALSYIEVDLASDATKPVQRPGKKVG